MSQAVESTGLKSNFKHLHFFLATTLGFGSCLARQPSSRCSVPPGRRLPSVRSVAAKGLDAASKGVTVSESALSTPVRQG